MSRSGVNPHIRRLVASVVLAAQGTQVLMKVLAAGVPIPTWPNGSSWCTFAEFDFLHRQAIKDRVKIGRAHV